MLRRALRLLGSPHEGREVVQEVFLSLIERPDQFEGKSSILTFLYAATTHRCLNRLRERTTRNRLLERAGNDSVLPQPPGSPEREAELRQLLVRLPEELAEVAVYQHLDGLTYDELAEVLGCSRRRVAYLVARLRAFSEEHHDQP